MAVWDVDNAVDVCNYLGLWLSANTRCSMTCRKGFSVKWVRPAKEQRSGGEWSHPGLTASRFAGYGICCPLIAEPVWAFDGLGNVELSTSVWAEQLG